MNYITTTELRTKSKTLVETLKGGGRLKLIHRSRGIGKIEPAYEPEPLSVKDINELKNLAKKLNLPRLLYKERERRYRKYLIEKYGR